MSIITLSYHWLLFLQENLSVEVSGKEWERSVLIIYSQPALRCALVSCQAVWTECDTVKPLIKVGTRVRRCQNPVSKWSSSNRSDSYQKKRWFCIGKRKWSILTVNIFFFIPIEGTKKKTWSPHNFHFVIWNPRTSGLRNSNKKPAPALHLEKQRPFLLLFL